MAIEINHVTTTPAQVGQGTPAESPAAGARKEADARSPHTPGTDQVTLTPEARQLRTLEAQVAELPVVDTRRVEAVRSALAEGRYEIDPQRIAGKFLQLERALAEPV